MPRTRSSKPAKPAPNEDSTLDTPSQSKALQLSVANPPKLFVLPKSASPDARIATLENPANGTPSRYLFCPERGFYEFTRLAAPKKTPRSWLLTTEKKMEDHRKTEEGDEGLGSGYITRNPDLFVATPIDTLFLVLPSLAPKSAKQTKQYFLSLDDHLDTLSSSHRHLQALLARHPALRAKIEKRMASCCDTVEAGDETMYRLSVEKLLTILVKKAERMCSAGFPGSMEDKFIKPALDIPVMSIKREESSISIVSTTSTTTETPIVVEAEESQSSTTTITTATSDSQTTTVTTPDDEQPPATLSTPPSVPPLLRLRTAITYLLNAYVPRTLHTSLQTLLSNSPSFAPLDSHLSGLSKLKAEAAALRSISDNISRKRSYEDDEEKAAEREEKKRRKEEEEKRKKGESRGIKQLKKVDTSGMKKLSSFFAKVPAKK